MTIPNLAFLNWHSVHILIGCYVNDNSDNHDDDDAYSDDDAYNDDGYDYYGSDTYTIDLFLQVAHVVRIPFSSHSVVLVILKVPFYR